MNFSRLRVLAFMVVLAVAFSCEKEDPVPPFVINNSVDPVDFLTDEKYQVLNIEVAYVEGYQPSTAALNNILAFMRARLNKSGGITLTQKSMAATGRLTVDVSLVREIEKARRTSVTGGGALTAWIMFLDAEYSQSTESQKVLGIAYGASSIAIFQKSVVSLTASNAVAKQALESLILSHETGHLLGLVNNGTPMAAPHQDNDHGAHCSNTECLMYWKSETNIDLTDLIGNNAIPTLDANCLADLRAAGGK